MIAFKLQSTVKLGYNGFWGPFKNIRYIQSSLYPNLAIYGQLTRYVDMIYMQCFLPFLMADTITWNLKQGPSFVNWYGYLATISFDLADDRRIVKTAGVHDGMTWTMASFTTWLLARQLCETCHAIHGHEHNLSVVSSVVWSVGTGKVY